MVGLLPLCAVTVIEPWQRERVPGLDRGPVLERLAATRRICFDTIDATGPGHLGVGERGILGLVNEDRLRQDPVTDAGRETSSSSPYGIRALSRASRGCSPLCSSRRRAGIPGGRIRRRSWTLACSARQLELARAGSGCR